MPQRALHRPSPRLVNQCFIGVDAQMTMQFPARLKGKDIAFEVGGKQEHKVPLCGALSFGLKPGGHTALHRSYRFIWSFQATPSLSMVVGRVNEPHHREVSAPMQLASLQLLSGPHRRRVWITPHS